LVESRWSSRNAYAVYKDKQNKKTTVWSNRLPNYKIENLDEWKLVNFNESLEKGMTAMLTFKKKKYYLDDRVVYEVLDDINNTSPLGTPT